MFDQARALFSALNRDRFQADLKKQIEYIGLLGWSASVADPGRRQERGH
jgi:hypothetical protein